jgi:hypothetical protein
MILAAAPLSSGAAPFAAASLPTGTFTALSGGGPNCPGGFDCSNFRVTCPGVDKPITGDLAVRKASANRLVMLFEAASGTHFAESAEANAFLDDLHDAGLMLVQVRWDDAWFESASGESAGLARLGCRPATVVKWVEEHLYKEQTHPTGSCGFCLFGISGGASAISYPLSHFGMDGLVDAVLPFGGPPHAALVKGCLPGYKGYTYATHTARNMDKAYGFTGGGPCENRDPSFTNRWTADAVDTGASDLVHPATRFVFLFGTDDNTIGPAHGEDYADHLRAAGSKMVFVEELQGVPHSPYKFAVGRAAVKAALLADSPGESEPPPPASGGTGGGSGSGSPTPSPTPKASSPTPTPTPGETTSSPQATAPSTPAGGFPWTVLLIALGPVAAVVAYRLLRRQPVVPRRRARPG